MTCYSLKDRSGKHIGFLCGRLGAHCECGGVAERLCDFPVGNGKTCDKKLCDFCGHLIGPNLDYCQAHHEEWRRFRDSGGVVRELENVEPFKGR